MKTEPPRFPFCAPGTKDLMVLTQNRDRRKYLLDRSPAVISGPGRPLPRVTISAQINSYATFHETPPSGCWNGLARKYRLLRLRMNRSREPLLGDHAVIGKDRRRFIVISIFDFTMSILLWLIYTVTLGTDWVKILKEEINIFAADFIHKSLFDVVLCAFCRMVVLLIFYAVIVVRSWLPVAITTAISSVFLIAKVLLYFNHEQNGLIQYLLVLTSFSVAWFELWLMPFKVLRRERRNYTRQPDSEYDDEEYPQGVQIARPRPPNRVVERLRTRNPRITTDDEGMTDFRSAQEFSSDDEATSRHRGEPVIPARIREIYDKAIKDAETRVSLLLTEAKRGNWKALRSENPIVLQGPDQSYFISADFTCLPQKLFQAIWKDSLKWNPQILQAKSLIPIDTRTELFHSISAPAMKGYISSRDFVDIRRINIDEENEVYMGMFVSVESSLVPPNQNKKIVRGVNGPSVFRVTGSDNSATLEWIMKTDLRGGLPKRLVQSSMVSYFTEHMDRLRKHMDTLSSA